VLPVALAAAVGAPSAGGQAGGVLWEGATPSENSGYAVAAGRELQIPLEAVGGFGANVRIGVSPRPRGAELTQTSTAPARAVFRWRPSTSQLGEHSLTFTAAGGGAAADPLRVFVHVGRTGAHRFRLSTVNGISRTGVLQRRVSALARPSAGARAVTSLRPVTPEEVPHVVYLVEGAIDAQRRYWLRVMLPILPNGSTGWIPRDAVTAFAKVDTHLVIDRARFRATLLRRGRPIFRSIVGVGEPRWPTPPGRFYIRERLTGFTDPIYGAIAFGTNGRSPVLTDWPGGGFIGIHGTNRPEILPGRVSHGCVRLRNASIRRLDRLMKVGTPVTIR
jgi:hypothetical protein